MAEAPYQPRDRRGTKPLGERWFGDGEWDWFVDDVDCDHKPWAWGCTQSKWRILSHGTRKSDRFVICTDRGQYVRLDPRRDGRRPGYRTFATPAEAGRYVRVHRLGVE